jgi:hypothetical protein
MVRLKKRPAFGTSADLETMLKQNVRLGGWAQAYALACASEKIR